MKLELLDTNSLDRIKAELIEKYVAFQNNDMRISISDQIELTYVDFDMISDYQDLDDNQSDSIAIVYCTFFCMGLDIELSFEKKAQIDCFVASYDKLDESEPYVHFENTIVPCQDLFRMIGYVLDTISR